MLDIISIGSATRDVFLKNVPFVIQKNKKSSTNYFVSLPLGSKIEIKDVLFETGGGGTNTAVTFSRLGLKAGIISVVGDDPSGKEIIANLKKEKVNTAFITTNAKKATGYSVILLTPGGKRTILVHRGASNLFNKNKIHWNKLKSQWFYISSLGGNVELLKQLVSYANKNKIKTAINPGFLELKTGFKKLKPILNKINVLILNREEASKLVKKPYNNFPLILKTLQKKLGPTMVVTDGPRNAFLIDNDKIYETQPLNVKIVNTTGAGDAFGSAFTSGIILKNDVDYALRLAILNSNYVITKMGSKRGLLKKRPNKQELKKVKIMIK